MKDASVSVYKLKLNVDFIKNNRILVQTESLTLQNKIKIKFHTRTKTRIMLTLSYNLDILELYCHGIELWIEITILRLNGVMSLCS